MTDRPPQAGTAREALAALKEELAARPVERLKWQVLRAFGALPTERRARRMRDRDYLWCALNLLLDAQRGGAAEDGTATAGENAAFDMERYERLSRGETA